MKSKALRIGITMGDPGGIGPEIITKALSRPSVNRLGRFVVIGDTWVLNKFGKKSPPQRLAGPPRFLAEKYKIIDLNNVARKKFSFGEISAGNGRASIEYIDKAIELIENGEIDCLVTAPISKAAIKLSGFKWPGHSEYLAKLTHTDNFAMMLLNKYLRTSLITRHIALNQVSGELNQDKIFKTIILTARALKQWFKIKNPRISVCALNPHASDRGAIGKEEQRIIIPAIKRASKSIGKLDGPFSSDVAFSKAKNREYDCVITMYHDQALIPLKVLGFDSGVNITIGLPFVRTSPLHGTAFDIAKTGSANPASLIEAIKTAARCAANRNIARKN